MRRAEAGAEWACLILLVAVTLGPVVYSWRLITRYAAIPLVEATPAAEPGGSSGSAVDRSGAVGIAIAPDGALYVADPSRRRLWASPDGSPESAEPLPVPELETPWDVAVGPGGKVYVLDQRSRNLHVVAPSGEPVAAFPVAKGGPIALAVGSDGAIYVSDPGAERLRKFLPDGGIDRSWGDGVEPGAVSLQMVSGVAVLEDGLLVAAGSSGGELVRLDRDGRVLSRTPAIGGVGFLALAPSGLAYMSDGNHDRVWILDRRGTTVGRVVGPGGDEAIFGQPRDLAVSAGRLFVVNANRVSVHGLPQSKEPG